jgi:hypothetical protein
MNEKINPVGLKGYQVTERMKELMGIKTINENKKTSVVELTKRGPDGNVYGIVRENHEYYIKITKKQNNLVVEDFQYMGGLQNKKQEVYPSYAKALKHLNLKFHSLNEAYGKSGQVNVFLDDKLLTEDYAAFESMSGSGFKAEGNMEGHMTSECCGAQTMEGMCMECGGPAYGSGMNELSDKQEKIAKLAGNPNEIGSDDLAALRAGKHMENEATGPWSQNNNDTDDITNLNQERGEEPYNPIHAAHAEYLSPMDRMHNSPEWVQAQHDAEGYDDNDEDLVPEMAAVHGMMEGGMGGSKLDQVMNMISRVDSKMDTGRKPEVWVSPENENCLYLSAEDGEYFADYYGEMDDSGHPYIDPRLEAIADKFDAYWDWVNPGVAVLCLDSLDETQQAVHDMMGEEEMTDKEKQFAALAEPKDEITYADKIAGATKKEGKLSIERAMSMMDEMIDELQESRSKKKI